MIINKTNIFQLNGVLICWGGISQRGINIYEYQHSAATWIVYSVHQSLNNSSHL